MTFIPERLVMQPEVEDVVEKAAPLVQGGVVSNPEVTA